MATDKKSFILYADLIKSIEHLTNEEKGILFNHLLEYVNDRNPILDDRLILTAWKPIELQLKRDLIKFEEVKVKRSEAGKASAEARALKIIQQTTTNPTSVESVEHTSTNPTDNVTENVNVNDNGSVIIEEPPKGVPFKIFVPDFESYPITYRQGLKTWWDYKIEKKQKYKPTGWETFVKSAMEDFPDAVKFNKALKYSMSNNYSGLHSKSSKPQFVPPNTASMEGEDYMKND